MTGKIKNILKSILPAGFILLLMFLWVSSNSIAQSIIVKSELEKKQILIGDQIRFRVEAEIHKDWKLSFPSFTDTLMDKIEILEASPLDTTFLSADILKIHRELLITSFDSGVYIIPGQAFIFSGNGISDTILSEPNFLMVNTFQIDSVQGMADIKPPLETPLVLEETIPYLAWTILVSALFLGAYFLYRRFRNRPTPEKTIKSEPKRPAHLIALDALDNLKKKKLWQQNRTKEYYTELSDIIRSYLENRFYIDAMELTTDETMRNISQIHTLRPEQSNQLRKILELADLVKFAKAEPMADENEQMFEVCYQWVLSSKETIDLRNESKNLNQEKQEPHV